MWVACVARGMFTAVPLTWVGKLEWLGCAQACSMQLHWHVLLLLRLRLQYCFKLVQQSVLCSAGRQLC